MLETAMANHPEHAGLAHMMILNDNCRRFRRFRRSLGNYDRGDLFEEERQKIWKGRLSELDKGFLEKTHFIISTDRHEQIR